MPQARANTTADMMVKPFNQCRKTPAPTVTAVRTTARRMAAGSAVCYSPLRRFPERKLALMMLDASLVVSHTINVEVLQP